MAEVLTLCDLTQSFSASGGGIRTYLDEKRAFIDTHTPHHHVLIIPGKRDRTTHEGRHTIIEIASPRVPGSPNYRLLLRSRAVIKALRLLRPDIIECLDAYNLPWAAIAYRREAPNTVLIAGYRTDFPAVYVEEIARKFMPRRLASQLKRRAYNYAGKLYNHFDGVYALNADMAQKLKDLGAGDVDVLPLGTYLEIFHPNKRDAAWRASLGVAAENPILIYAGRIDREKKTDVVLEAFFRLPTDINASLVMLGDGGLKDNLTKQSAGKRVHFPGFITDRNRLAAMLASSDIYVSAMAHETFGISIIEAQACGLPVIGVSAGAMLERVPPSLGMLGPIGDAEIMAANIASLWHSGNINMMSQNARKHVEMHFSWAKTFEYLFGHIYTKAVGRNIIGM